MKIKIQVHKNTAFVSEELALAATGANPEEAVKLLIKKIRAVHPQAALELPYLGATFTPHWEDLRRYEDLERGKKKIEADDFEQSQNVGSKLQKFTS